MAELTIEQKAARYDEIIKGLRDFYRDYDTVSRLIDVKEELANLVPELKESEDERIIKAIIEIVKKDEERIGTNAHLKKIQWLEKQAKQILDNSADTSKPYGQRRECADCQFNYAGECKGSCSMKRGEQNPTDKAASKYHVGDWVVTAKGEVEQIDKNYKNIDNVWCYRCRNQEGEISTADVAMYDIVSHLWTLKDVKDGDILIDFEGMATPFKFRRISHSKVDGSQIIAYGGVDDEGNFQTCDYDEVWCGVDRVAPASKEQIHFLNERMDNAGYYWSEEEEMYVKIERYPITDKI